MADKRARERDEGEGEGGYAPVGSPSGDRGAERPRYEPLPGNPMATTEGSVDVRSTAAGLGGPGYWESFRLTDAQRAALAERPAWGKALRAGNVVAAGMTPEDYLRWEVQQAVDKANDDVPCYERAKLERELERRLKALDR